MARPTWIQNPWICCNQTCFSVYKIIIVLNMENVRIRKRIIYLSGFGIGRTYICFKNKRTNVITTARYESDAKNMVSSPVISNKSPAPTGRTFRRSAQPTPRSTEGKFVLYIEFNSRLFTSPADIGTGLNLAARLEPRQRSLEFATKD